MSPADQTARFKARCETSFATRFEIREVEWPAGKDQLSAIRTAVFIQEQQVPPALEWDGLDTEARHLLALDLSGRAVGCARILGNGSIGRMAVLPDWRGRGIGTALLQEAIRLCQLHGWQPVRLSAQTYAIPFYAKAGFTVCSDEYPDAGIPHRDMQLSNAPL